MTNRAKLESGHAHIHLLFPEKTDNEQRDQYHNLLSDGEKERYNNLRNPKVKDQYLLTRSLVRTVLPPYLEEKPHTISFTYNEHGKPELVTKENQPNIQFNLSHSEGLIALAITLDKDIGVDVENISRKNATMEIAERFFSKREILDLQKAPENEQNSRFFDLWTLKEAYIKARGTGLTLPLSQFSFIFEEAEPKVIFAPELDDDASQWSFWLSSPTERHRLALAVKTASLSVFLAVNSS